MHHDRMADDVADARLKIFFISSQSELAIDIASVVEDFKDNYQIHKWMDDHTPGTVTLEIVEQIHQADVIVADLCSDNPNVYYELGLAHSLGRATILFKKKGVPLPFDVHVERAIEVDDKNGTIENTATLHSKLRSALQDIVNNPDLTGTAIQHHLRDLQDVPPPPDGWREIAIAGEAKRLSPENATLGTWIYEGLHGLGEIIDVSFESGGRIRFRIRFTNGDLRELYYSPEARLFVAPQHVQEWLRRRGRI